MNTHTILGVEIEVQSEHANGPTVLLKQEWGGTVHQVEVHELHLRWLAQRLGDPSMAGMQRTLLRCWDMATALQRDLKLTADFGREDLDLELARTVELVDFLAFICADFKEQNDTSVRSMELPVARPRPAKPVGDLFAQGANQ